MSVSIVGGESLLGRELRDQLAEKGIKAALKLVGSEVEIPGLIKVEKEEEDPIVLTALDRDALLETTVLFMAGLPVASVRTMELAATAGAKPVVVDLSYGLEERPDARLRAPSLEPPGMQYPAGTVHVVAHPAAIVIATVLSRIQKKHPVTRAVVEVFEPASERGQAGLTELQQQTRNLFAFKGMDKAVFDSQLAFNLLPRYGDDAPQKLEDIEARIDRHVATLLGSMKVTPLPSLRLIQAPVFHGYSFSFWIEFENNPGVTAVSEALASAQVEVRAKDLEPPSNVGSVGQAGTTAGLIEQDRNDPKAIWLWAVADNFRISVDEAIEAARPALGQITERK